MPCFLQDYDASSPKEAPGLPPASREALEMQGEGAREKTDLALPKPHHTRLGDSIPLPTQHQPRAGLLYGVGKGLPWSLELLNPHDRYPRILRTCQDQAVAVTNSKHTCPCSPNMQILPSSDHSENKPFPTISPCIKNILVSQSRKQLTKSKISTNLHSWRTSWLFCLPPSLPCILPFPSPPHTFFPLLPGKENPGLWALLFSKWGTCKAITPGICQKERSASVSSRHPLGIENSSPEILWSRVDLSVGTWCIFLMKTEPQDTCRKQS